MLGRVLRHRWDQLAVAMLAVLLGTALISALANLSFDRSFFNVFSFVKLGFSPYYCNFYFSKSIFKIY